MRYYGKVGYVSTKNEGRGIWSDEVTEREYYGDVIRNTRRWENGSGINDSISVNNSISIVADPYAYDHFSSIRYVWWGDSKWKVTDITIDRPRILLTIGGVYNG